MRRCSRSCLAASLGLSLLFAAACTVQGPPGEAGEDGEDGEDGDDGEPGPTIVETCHLLVEATIPSTNPTMTAPGQVMHFTSDDVTAGCDGMLSIEDTSRVIAPRDGVYVVTGTLGFDEDDGDGDARGAIVLTGSTEAVAAEFVGPGPAGGQAIVVSFAGTVPLAAGEFVRLLAIQDSGESLSTNALFSMTYVSPLPEEP